MEANETLDNISRALGEPFPKNALKTRQGQGSRQFTYVEGHTVIHRLNDATNNTWDLSIVSIDTMQLGPKTMVRAHVALTIPGLGRREHIGVQAVDERGGEDLVKGAITDALKKAATLFGVGLELYGPDYEAGEVAHTPQAAPRNAGATQTNETAKPAQDDAQPQRLSQGQLNVIQKHQKDLGWSVDDMKLIVAAHDYTTIKEFSADQGMKLIKVMSDPATADPYIALLRKPEPATQAAMIPNSNAAERARQ